MRLNKLAKIPQKILLWLIAIYQKVLSPDHGLLKHNHPYGFCRFRPTCSEYAQQAVSRYGVFKGVFMAIRRIIRCNPFNQGGWDPLK